MASFMSIQEVARLHKVTKRCVSYWIERGRMPAQRVGNTYIIRENDAMKRPSAE